MPYDMCSPINKRIEREFVNEHDVRKNENLRRKRKDNKTNHF